MRYRMVLCAALLACGVTSSPVLAQPTQAEIEASKKAAADAANKAFDDFKDGKYDAAIAGFQKADKAFHALKFVLYVGRAQAKLGRLVAARATYESIVKEQLPAYAPPEFFTAQADAKKELVDLIARIPTLQIQGGPGMKAITLDGTPAALGAPLSLDPGEHTITATLADQRPFSKKVTLKERDAKVETLEPPGAAAAATSTSSASTAPTATAPSPLPSTSASADATAISTGALPGPSAAPSSSGSFLSTMPVATKVGYGVGAAGLVLGAVLGGLTLAKKGDYDALRAATPLDPTAVNAAASQGRTFGVVADVGFLAAIAGIAVGTIVWIVAPRTSGASATSGAAGAARAPAMGRSALASSGASALATGPGVFVSPRANGLTVGGSF